MKYYIGIDIGGTNIKGVVLEELEKRPRTILYGTSRVPHGTRPEIKKKFTTPTPKNKKGLLKVLEERIKPLVEKYEIAGIGVGFPGVVDPEQGILVKTTNLTFIDGWNFQEFFTTLSPQIKGDNDVHCFLRAEARYGAGVGHKNALALTVGTGIGGGIMIDGKVYHGSHYSAEEFGRMIVSDKRDLETLGTKKTGLTPRERSKFIGIGIANLVNILDPEIVILGGGAITGGDIDLSTVRAEVKKHIMSPLAKNTPIVKGTLGDLAGAIGAALLVVSNK